MKDGSINSICSNVESWNFHISNFIKQVENTSKWRFHSGFYESSQQLQGFRILYGTHQVSFISLYLISYIKNLKRVTDCTLHILSAYQAARFQNDFPLATFGFTLTCPHPMRKWDSDQATPLAKPPHWQPMRRPSTMCDIYSSLEFGARANFLVNEALLVVSLLLIKGVWHFVTPAWAKPEEKAAKASAWRPRHCRATPSR